MTKKNRPKSESKDSTPKNTVESQVINADGQYMCPVPRIQCICPGVDPIVGCKSFVFIPCTKNDCAVQTKPCHLDCILALEADLLAEHKHVYHKKEKWAKSIGQVRNVWERTGKSLIRCRCEKGIIIFDDYALKKAQKDFEEDKKTKKSHKKRFAPAEYKMRHLVDCSEDFGYDSITPYHDFTYAEGLGLV